MCLALVGYETTVRTATASTHDSNIVISVSANWTNQKRAIEDAGEARAKNSDWLSVGVASVALVVSASSLYVSYWTYAAQKEDVKIRCDDTDETGPITSENDRHFMLFTWRASIDNKSTSQTTTVSDVRAYYLSDDGVIRSETLAGDVTGKIKIEAGTTATVLVRSSAPISSKAAGTRGVAEAKTFEDVQKILVNGMRP